MKKRTKVILAISVLLLCAFISGAVGNWIGYHQGHWDLFEDPKISPSGDYIVEKMYGYDRARYVRFVIYSKHYSEEYICEKKFYIRFATIIDWGKEDMLWVYSGDVGTYYWIMEEGSWIQKIPDKNIVTDFASDSIKKEWEA